MQTPIQIKPVKLSGLPIVLSVIRSLKLRELLSQTVRDDPRDKIPVHDTLVIMLCNVVMERFPLYKVGEWANQEQIRYEAKCDGIFPLITNLRTRAVRCLRSTSSNPGLKNATSSLSPCTMWLRCS